MSFFLLTVMTIYHIYGYYIKGGVFMKKITGLGFAKRVFAVVLALGLLLILPACFDDSDPVKESYSSSGSSGTPQKKDESFGLNETAVFKTLKFTATELKESYGDEFFYPEDGNVFVGVKFIVENISDEEQSISSILLFEGYVDDILCDYSFSADAAFDSTVDGTIAAGKKLVGWYAVEIPENWSTLELNVQADWLSNSSATFVFEK